VTGGAVTGGAVTGGAVTGGAVTGGAVTGGAVTGGAVTGGAVTGGAETTGANPDSGASVVGGELLLLGAPEPDAAKAIPPTAISATTIPVTTGRGLKLKECSAHQLCLSGTGTAAWKGHAVATGPTPDSTDGTACEIGGGGR
jgi:hypothetical protein